MMRWLAVGAVAVGSLLLLSCSQEDSQSGKVSVVTSLPLFADFVENIGGERVEVTSLLPSGGDPHTYEPSPRDVQRVSEADLAVINGLGLEPAVANIIQTNLPGEAPLIKLGEQVGGVEGGDPHLWMDLDVARRYAEIIRDTLIAADAEGRDTYEQNFRAYSAELDELDDYVQQQVESIPPQNRKLVTAHEAFTHFADYLGFEVLEFVAHAPGQEPSPGDVADIARAIESEGLLAVFGEPQIEEEGRILQQAAEDAGVQFCTLYSDSLDDRVKSYVELMRFNADELARCLGGDDG